MEKAKKAMLAHATFVPLRRRKDAWVSVGFVAEVRNKKIDP